jgi:hypothetical protein
LPNFLVDFFLIVISPLPFYFPCSPLYYYSRLCSHQHHADGLRQLAEQSLRNLQATRVMNRDELAQEEQEHHVYGLGGGGGGGGSPTRESPSNPPSSFFSSSTSAGGGAGAGAGAGVGGNTAMQAGYTMRRSFPEVDATANDAAANDADNNSVTPTPSVASSAQTPASPNRLGKVVHSDSALWAVEDGSEDDLSV